MVKPFAVYFDGVKLFQAYWKGYTHHGGYTRWCFQKKIVCTTLIAHLHWRAKKLLEYCRWAIITESTFSDVVCVCNDIALPLAPEDNQTMHIGITIENGVPWPFGALIGMQKDYMGVFPEMIKKQNAIYFVNKIKLNFLNKIM